MSCLAEDFRFCLLIGVGGFWVLKGEGGKKKKTLVRKAERWGWEKQARRTAELH